MGNTSTSTSSNAARKRNTFVVNCHYINKIELNRQYVD